MAQTYPTLFSPLKIGKKIVKNRIALAPISYIKRSPDGGFAEENIGETVVIIGGGLVGAETGIHLLELGKKVTIVEMTNQVAMNCPGTHHEVCLTRLKNAERLTETNCVSVSDEGVTVEHNGLERQIPADTVLLAAGIRSLTEEAYALGIGMTEFEVIGDAAKPGKILDATKTGFFRAMNL